MAQDDTQIPSTEIFLTTGIQISSCFLLLFFFNFQQIHIGKCSFWKPKAIHLLIYIVSIIVVILFVAHWTCHAKPKSIKIFLVLHTHHTFTFIHIHLYTQRHAHTQKKPRCIPKKKFVFPSFFLAEKKKSNSWAKWKKKVFNPLPAFLHFIVHTCTPVLHVYMHIHAYVYMGNSARWKNFFHIFCRGHFAKKGMHFRWIFRESWRFREPAILSSG